MPQADQTYICLTLCANGL